MKHHFLNLNLARTAGLVLLASSQMVLSSFAGVQEQIVGSFSSSLCPAYAVGNTGWGLRSSGLYYTLFGVDLSEPSAAVQTGSLSVLLNNYPAGAAVTVNPKYPNYLFVFGCYNWGYLSPAYKLELQAYDIRFPASPLHLSDLDLTSYDTAVGVTAIRNIGNYVILAGNHRPLGSTTTQYMLWQLNVSNPLHMTLAAQASLKVTALEANENIVCVINGNNLVILDPNTGLTTKATVAASSVTALHLDGNLLYADRGTSSTLVFDVTDSSHPKQLGIIPWVGTFVANGLGYRCSAGTLYVTDLSNPLAPVPAAPLWLGGMGGLGAVDGNRLYCPISDQTIVLDVERTVPPTITQQPQTLTAHPADRVTFQLAVTGTAPLSYQWSKNGVLLAGQTNTSLTLTQVQLADNASQFTCSVSNVAGSVTSQAATLTVLPVAPLIVPGSLKLPRKGQCQFTVSGSVGATYEIQCTSDFKTWTVLGNLTLADSAATFLDTTAPLGKRFYRARLVQ